MQWWRFLCHDATCPFATCANSPRLSHRLRILCSGDIGPPRPLRARSPLIRLAPDGGTLAHFALLRFDWVCLLIECKTDIERKSQMIRRTGRRQFLQTMAATTAGAASGCQTGSGGPDDAPGVGGHPPAGSGGAAGDTAMSGGASGVATGGNESGAGGSGGDRKSVV